MCQFQGERDPLAAAKKDMEDHFDADPVPKLGLLRVSMTYMDPDDAKTIVEEMVNKHIDLVKKGPVGGGAEEGGVAPEAAEPGPGSS